MKPIWSFPKMSLDSALGWWAEAQQAAQQALALRPRMVEAQNVAQHADSKLKATPMLYRHAARRREAAGDFYGMARYYLGAARATMAPDDFVLAGEQCERHRLWDQAQQAFAQAVKLRQDHPGARNGLERLEIKRTPPIPLDRPYYEVTEMENLLEWFISRNDAEGAVAFFAAHLQARPQSLPALRCLARAQEHARQPEVAIETLKKALGQSQREDRPDLYVHLAALHRKLGEDQEALRMCDLACKIDSMHAGAIALLAEMDVRVPPPRFELERRWDEFARADRYEEAIAYYQKWVTDNEQAPEPYGFLGRGYLRLGKVEEALDAYRQQAIRSEKDQDWVRFGELAADEGFFADAEAAFKAALAINPSNSTATDKSPLALAAPDGVDAPARGPLRSR